MARHHAAIATACSRIRASFLELPKADRWIIGPGGLAAIERGKAGIPSIVNLATISGRFCLRQTKLLYLPVDRLRAIGLPQPPQTGRASTVG